MASIQVCPAGGEMCWQNIPKKRSLEMERSTKKMKMPRTNPRLHACPIPIQERWWQKKSSKEIFRAIQFAFSKDPTLSIRRACQLYGISRSGYYKWKNRIESATSNKAQDIDLKIKEIAQKFPEFGYRRVTKELKRRGYVVNHKRVLRVMHDTILL